MKDAAEIVTENRDERNVGDVYEENETVMEASKNDLERIPDSISHRNYISVRGTCSDGDSGSDVRKKLGDETGTDDQKCAESDSE